MTRLTCATVIVCTALVCVTAYRIAWVEAAAWGMCR